MKFDKIIHEPARLRIMMILSGVESADFNFLLSTLGLSKGFSRAKFQIPAINSPKRVLTL